MQSKTTHKATSKPELCRWRCFTGYFFGTTAYLCFWNEKVKQYRQEKRKPKPIRKSEQESHAYNKKKPKQKPTQQTKTNKQKTFDGRRAFYTDRYQEILGTALKRLFRILKKNFCIQKNSFVPSFKTSKISLKIFFTLPSVSSLTGNSLQSPTFWLFLLEKNNILTVYC